MARYAAIGYSEGYSSGTRPLTRPEGARMSHASDTVQVLDLPYLAPQGERVAVAYGMAYYLTGCCGASAKGVEHGVACRSCYSLIPDWMGDAVTADDTRERVELFASRVTLGTDAVAEAADKIAAALAQ